MVARKTVCLRRLGGSRRGEEQAGRFFANPKVTAAGIVESWSQQTSAAVAGRHILAIQDTTEVKFPTTAQRRRGLGPVKKGNTYGVVAHAMIAVDAASHACRSLYTLVAVYACVAISARASGGTRRASSPR